MATITKINARTGARNVVRTTFNRKSRVWDVELDGVAVGTVLRTPDGRFIPGETGEAFVSVALAALALLDGLNWTAPAGEAAPGG